jgi:hypothetical protein
MKCPSCNTQIGVFSKSTNKWGKIKTCDKCQKSYRVKLNYGKFLVLTIPLGFKAAFVVQGSLNNIIIALVFGFVAMFSLEADDA